jgi:hypothetical protein
MVSGTVRVREYGTTNATNNLPKPISDDNVDEVKRSTTSAREGGAHDLRVT